MKKVLVVLVGVLTAVCLIVPQVVEAGGRGGSTSVRTSTRVKTSQQQAQRQSMSRSGNSRISRSGNSNNRNSLNARTGDQRQTVVVNNGDRGSRGGRGGRGGGCAPFFGGGFGGGFAGGYGGGCAIPGPQYYAAPAPAPCPPPQAAYQPYEEQGYYPAPPPAPAAPNGGTYVKQGDININIEIKDGKPAVKSVASSAPAKKDCPPKVSVNQQVIQSNPQNNGGTQTLQPGFQQKSGESSPPAVYNAPVKEAPAARTVLVKAPAEKSAPPIKPAAVYQQKSQEIPSALGNLIKEANYKQ